MPPPRQYDMASAQRGLKSPDQAEQIAAINFLYATLSNPVSVRALVDGYLYGAYDLNMSRRPRDPKIYDSDLGISILSQILTVNSVSNSDKEDVAREILGEYEEGHGMTGHPEPKLRLMAARFLASDGSRRLDLVPKKIKKMTLEELAAYMEACLKNPARTDSDSVALSGVFSALGELSPSDAKLTNDILIKILPSKNSFLQVGNRNPRPSILVPAFKTAIHGGSDLSFYSAHALEMMKNNPGMPGQEDLIKDVIQSKPKDMNEFRSDVYNTNKNMMLDTYGRRLTGPTPESAALLKELGEDDAMQIVNTFRSISQNPDDVAKLEIDAIKDSRRKIELIKAHLKKFKEQAIEACSGGMGLDAQAIAFRDLLPEVTRTQGLSLAKAIFEAGSDDVKAGVLSSVGMLWPGGDLRAYVIKGTEPLAGMARELMKKKGLEHMLPSISFPQRKDHSQQRKDHEL